MPALVTALDPDGHLHPDAHQHNVSRLVEAGAGGIVIGGSTGEGPYLEAGERTTLVGRARDAFPDLTIVCGIFAESTRQAHTQICEATDAGADAVLVVTPTTLVRDRRSWIVDYFEQVADMCPLPVFLYTVPRVTGYELPCESVAELAGHPNIAGMKDSGGDVSRLDDVAAILSDDFIVYAGASRALADSFDRGAHGAITASANYAFSTVAAAASGDRNAQRALSEATSVVERYGVVGTKFAAALAGLRPGPGRAPLPHLDEDAQDAITDAYRRLTATS
jgi:dihydrodipicolinate synthase/N-acetylneuraminate lyase